MLSAHRCFNKEDIPMRNKDTRERVKTEKGEGAKRRGGKILSVIIAVCAGVTLLNYTVYLVKLLIFPEQTLSYIITFIVLAITLVPILQRRKIKKITGRLFPFLKAVFAAGLAFYVLSFAFMCGYIAWGSGAESAPEELPDKTVFVVFGAKVNGSGDNVYPGNSLRKRLDCTAHLMQSAPQSVCIVTGGRGVDEARAEGDVMRDYLVSIGIDGARIYAETEAENTIENIENSKAIIEKELKGYSIACVSSDFHIPRIQLLADKYDLGADYYYYAPCPNVFVLYTSLVREYMSYGKLLLFGKL